MKKYILFISLMPLLQASQCNKKNPDCDGHSHSALIIKNNSGLKINYAFYWNYPDTIITKEQSPLYYSQKAVASGDSVIRGAGMGTCWEVVFMDKPREWIYFFNEDSLEQIPWHIIKTTGRGILERRELNLSYLQQRNFVVTYP